VSGSRPTPFVQDIHDDGRRRATWCVELPRVIARRSAIPRPTGFSDALPVKPICRAAMTKRRADNAEIN